MLDHISIGEKLHTIIRDDILSGRYKPGERLFFDRIAAENQVSMTPIKEAFMHLEKENLVVTVSRRGTFVRKFTATQIDEYYQIRLVLEELAVKLICTHGLTEEYELEMTTACKNLDRHAQNNEPKKCINDDINFHKLLVQASNNEELYSLIKTLPVTNLYNFALSSEIYMKNSDSYVNEHRTIIALLKDRDAKKVCELLEHHIAIMYNPADN
jgi:DNA-binding GntR family transcriptional regulator